jgi:hypothetical protein
VGRVEKGIPRHDTILVCEHARLMQTIQYLHACMHIICVCMHDAHTHKHTHTHTHTQESQRFFL